MEIKNSKMIKACKICDSMGHWLVRPCIGLILCDDCKKLYDSGNLYVREQVNTWKKIKVMRKRRR
jgi:hypothetical protein